MIVIENKKNVRE